MPPYANYADLTDFIKQLAAKEQLKLSELAARLRWSRTYMFGVITKKDDAGNVIEPRFVPSQARCDHLARYANVDPRIVRVLAGHETPPREDRDLQAITDLAASLPPDGRKELIQYIDLFLMAKYKVKRRK